MKNINNFIYPQHLKPPRWNITLIKVEDKADLARRILRSRYKSDDVVNKKL
jgi:hypothetical protein